MTGAKIWGFYIKGSTKRIEEENSSCLGTDSSINFNNCKVFPNLRLESTTKNIEGVFVMIKDYNDYDLLNY